MINDICRITLLTVSKRTYLMRQLTVLFINYHLYMRAPYSIFHHNELLPSPVKRLGALHAKQSMLNDIVSAASC